MIYTDDTEGEARRFYTYNHKGWRVPTSTAHFIESKSATPQIHSRLARDLMERSGVLGASNVEILSNHLSRNSAKMITFGTLVDALRGGFPGVSEDDYAGMVDYLLEFLRVLGEVRPREIALLSVARRKQARDEGVADQAVMWHGYLRLAARLRDLRPDDWQVALGSLAEPFNYQDSGGSYRLDLFLRHNPVWKAKEVIAQGKTGLRVVNNRQSRQGAYEVLCDVAGVPLEAAPPASV